MANPYYPPSAYGYPASAPRPQTNSPYGAGYTPPEGGMFGMSPVGTPGQSQHPSQAGSPATSLHRAAYPHSSHSASYATPAYATPYGSAQAPPTAHGGAQQYTTHMSPHLLVPLPASSPAGFAGLGAAAPAYGPLAAANPSPPQVPRPRNITMAPSQGFKEPLVQCDRCGVAVELSRMWTHYDTNACRNAQATLQQGGVAPQSSRRPPGPGRTVLGPAAAAPVRTTLESAMARSTAGRK